MLKKLLPYLQHKKKVTIVIFFLFLSFVTIAQRNISINGVVTNSKGEPLMGLSITVKGTGIGTSSNAKGSYSIDVPEDGTLIFSYLGFATQEIPVNGRLKIDVEMVEASVSVLDQVVVVGYGTQKKKNLTGAVVSIKNEDLVKAPVASVSNMLAGRLPGLITKQGNGEPGSDNADLYIRGFGSPLIIIDGVEGNLNSITPAEIESISVLKDASSAIYGARAGNGVILVTTIRGKRGKPLITLNSSYTLQGVTKFPKPVNAGQYATLMREAAINAGVAQNNLPYSEDDIELYFNGADPEGHPNTDWYNVVMNDWSPMQDHNLSVSGGSDQIRYYGFLGYLDQVGMFKSGDDQFKRYNVRMNVDADITRNLTVSFNLSGMIGNVQRPTRSGSAFWLDFYNSHPVRHSAFPDPTKIPYQGQGTFNPVANSNIDLGGYQRNENNQIIGTLSMNYNIPAVEGLSFKAFANYTQNTGETKNWTKQFSMWNYNFQSDVYTLAVKSSWPTRLTQTFNKNKLITGQFSLNYNRIFNKNHSVNGLLLYEIIDYNSYFISAYRQNYITDAIDYLFAGGNTDQLADGNASETGRSSLAARINYGYKGKYLLETTLRYDGSPKFPKDKRWGFFPSVSVGWRISEENFMKENIDWINNLKIRASLSNTGYDATGAFQYLTGYQFDGEYVLGGAVQQGLNSTGIANPNITWESMKTYNAGIELSVLNNKFYTEVDVFYRLREGMLANRIGALPNTFGGNLPAENINSQSNRGFEFVLGHRNKIGQFKYDISANISWARAKWEHFEEPAYVDPDQIRINQQTGKWTDIYFGYKSDGLFTSQEEIDNLTLNQDQRGNITLRPGDIKYVDINKDGILDWKDKVEIGNGGIPLIMYGFNINAQYKGFDFSVLFQGADKFNVYLTQIDILSPRTPTETVWKYRWTPENNDPHAIIARQARNSGPNKNVTSDFYLKDASYLRLKNVSLGYTLPQNWLNPIGIDHLKVYVAGVNLLTFSGLSKYGTDPEAETIGGNTLNRQLGWYYPQQRTISAGVKISF